MRKCASSDSASFFSKRELTFTLYVSSSVRLSVVCRLSVTFVRPTQAIEIFGNVSMPFGTLAIPDLSVKIFTEIVLEEPLRRGNGVKRKRGSQM